MTVEWILTDDGRYRAVDPVEEIASIVSRARELSARNRAAIETSRALIERVRQARRARQAWECASILQRVH